MDTYIEQFRNSSLASNMDLVSKIKESSVSDEMIEEIKHADGMKEKAILILSTIYDPEIPINIIQLGLVYGMVIEDENNMRITMTLTSPTCPVVDQILQEIENRFKQYVPECNDLFIDIVWDPEWNREMISEEGLLELLMW